MASTWSVYTMVLENLIFMVSHGLSQARPRPRGLALAWKKWSMTATAGTEIGEDVSASGHIVTDAPDVPQAAEAAKLAGGHSLLSPSEWCTSLTSVQPLFALFNATNMAHRWTLSCSCSMQEDTCKQMGNSQCDWTHSKENKLKHCKWCWWWISGRGEKNSSWWQQLSALYSRDFCNSIGSEQWLSHASIDWIIGTYAVLGLGNLRPWGVTAPTLFTCFLSAWLSFPDLQHILWPTRPSHQFVKLTWPFRRMFLCSGRHFPSYFFS